MGEEQNQGGFTPAFATVSEGEHRAEGHKGACSGRSAKSANRAIGELTELNWPGSSSHSRTLSFGSPKFKHPGRQVWRRSLPGTRWMSGCQECICSGDCIL